VSPAPERNRNVSSRPDAADGDPHIAAARQGGRARVLPARTASVHKPVRVLGSASMGQDLVRAISGAAAAVDYVDAAGSSPAVDFSIVARATTVCVGDTEADAIQAAADVARELAQRRIRITDLTWARIPGPVEEEWQWSLTLTLATRDPGTGEYPGEVHHGDRPPTAT